jgi:hypothetical protein
MKMQSYLLLAALAVLGAVIELIAARWGVDGAVVGGFLCGLAVLAGARALEIDVERFYVMALAACAGSLLGLVLGVAGAGMRVTGLAWLAPLAAVLPAAVPALAKIVRVALCGMPLRGVLSFGCPRCHLEVCDNCWQFERGRCRLCEANQAALFPLELAWWHARFKQQAREGRCALCLRTADWDVAHWACRGCGHSQCRLCWDDNNGQCSRCGWIVPDLPPDVSEFAAAGQRPERMHRQA